MGIAVLVFGFFYTIIAVVSFALLIRYSKLNYLLVLLTVLIIFFGLPLLYNFLGKSTFNETCQVHSKVNIHQPIYQAKSLKIKSLNNFNDIAAYTYLLLGFEFIETEENQINYKYFIDDNTSSHCTSGCYTCNKKLEEGKCFARMKVADIQSKYMLDLEEKVIRLPVFFNIYQHDNISLYDRKTEQTVMILQDISWDQGWPISMFGFKKERCIEEKRDEFFKQFILNIKEGSKEVPHLRFSDGDIGI